MDLQPNVGLFITGNQLKTLECTEIVGGGQIYRRKQVNLSQTINWYGKFGYSEKALAEE